MAASLPTPDVLSPIMLFAGDSDKMMESNERGGTVLVPTRPLVDSAGLRVSSGSSVALPSGVACFLSTSNISSCWEASFATVSRSLMLD